MSELLDVVGIGAGPSNLSLAALARPIADLRLSVLERQVSFSWHRGMMLFDSAVQTDPIKDLVTLVDPTSPYSFLNFLVDQKRIYRYVVSSRGHVSRREFEQYYAWAASRLESVHFGVEVESVDHDGSAFVVHSPNRACRARNVVLGVGKAPFVPECARALIGDNVFHSSRYLLHRNTPTAGRSVLLVGGGQSAAEIATHLLSDPDNLPRRFVWLSGRHGFLPMDDSPFANEWFNPRYVRYFNGLDRERRRELLGQQLLASDGVTESLLLSIYRRLYVLDYLERRPFTHELLGGHRLVGLKAVGGSFEAMVHSPESDETCAVSADVVVLATGYREVVPACLAPLRRRFVLEDDHYRVEPDFSVAWDGPSEQRLFVQGGARGSHGVADSNLSLIAWRSAVILNRICGRTVYSVEREGVTLALRSADDRRPSLETAGRLHAC